MAEMREAIDRALALEGLRLSKDERQRLGRRIHMETAELTDLDTSRAIDFWVARATATNDPVAVINEVLARYPVPHDAAKIVQNLVAMVESGGKPPRRMRG